MMDMHDHSSSSSHHEMMVADFKKRFFFSFLLMIPILALSPMIQMFLHLNWRFSGDSYLLLGLSTVLFVYGGWPFLTGAMRELKKKSPAMMTLIALAICVAYFYSAYTVFTGSNGDFFWELATLIVIMLLGHWIEMRSVMGASKSLEDLAKLLPETAHVIESDGSITKTPVGKLQKGDKILVKPGEKIPIDGQIFEGSTQVDESMITGESIPVDKKKDDNVVGGSINGSGAIRFTVSKVGDETFLSQVIQLVKDAQSSRSGTQRLADKAAKWLFYLAVVAGTATFLVWLFLGKGVSFSIERAVSVIIITCPHALGLAMPLVTAVSTSIGAKNGLLIKDRGAFENGRKINTVVFDKTGTLTEGKFGVTDVVPYGISEKALLSIASSVETSSEHPIAKGIVEAAKKIPQVKVEDVQNITGMGLKAQVDGKEICIVSPGYLDQERIEYDKTAFGKLAAQGKTVVFVLKEQKPIGMLALADIVKQSAREAVSDLRAMDESSIMITGDNAKVAGSVGKQVGIDQVMAQVLPQEKAEKIRQMQIDGRLVAMTGDGVNDAPSLAQANLGIAIGAGTDVAIETADVILVKSNPKDVVSVLKLSRATYRKMLQNLFWAVCYNVVALPLAAGVLYYQGIVISPAVGALFMSLSTVIVAINAKLLKI